MTEAQARPLPRQDRRIHARDRWVGAVLRAVRVERTDLSLGAAARLLGWPLTTMWRTENGHRPTTSEDVATIVTAYGLPVRDRAALVAAARGDDPSCIWEPPLPGVPPESGAYASYLNNATTLTE